MAETRTFPNHAPGDVVEQRLLGADADFRYCWDLEVVDEFGNAMWKPHRYDLKTGDLVLHPPINWMELPGSQSDFLKCPIFECLYHGTRGPGKSITLLMDFAKDVGKGYGKNWRGVLFRKTFGDLDDIVRKIDDTFPKLYPNFRFLRSKSEYKAEWIDGEALMLRPLESEKDYEEYHGHEYPWIGFEELTQWENDKAYKLMFSCCRPTGPGIPCRVRATTNPYGVGHGWVKKRFQLPHKSGVPICNPNEVPRVAIRGVLSENFVLLHTAPNYPQQIVQAATNPAQADAWLTGNWDVNAGGMFDDVWDSQVHIIPNFPSRLIPPSWRITRSYDHGQSRPFSVGWWLESNGEPVKFNGIEYGSVRGDLILFSEWYGTDGSDPNVGLRMFAPDIAQGIIDREDDLGLRGRVMSLGGPADTEIWSKDQRGTGRAPIDDMNDMGVYWEKADKTPGSRTRGWQMIRSYLANARPHKDGTRDKPGMFVCARCVWWIDLVPKAPRSDKDMDDIPDKYPDHAGDMTRYRVNWQIPGMWRREF